jgi:hypothetical protein
MPALDTLGFLPPRTGGHPRAARSRLAALVLGVGLLAAAPAAHARSYEDVVVDDSTCNWRLGVPSYGSDRRGGVDSSDFIRLGAHTGKWLEWDGWLDEAAYHNNQSGGAVLTPATIEDHYRLATTGT